MEVSQRFQWQAPHRGASLVTALRRKVISGLKRLSKAWRWLLYGLIGFLFSILMFANFSYAIDPPLSYGEWREISINELTG